MRPSRQQSRHVVSIVPDWRRVRGILCVALALPFFAACTFPGSTKPTVKVGLSAPFEGMDRDLGYEVLHAVRLAVRQRNEVGGIADRYLVELVALNDFGEAEEAITQAHKMAVDPDVLGVMGGLSPESSHAAIAEYQSLGLAYLYPDASLSHGVSIAEPDVKPGFVAGYQSVSGGAPPGPLAVWAYGAAMRLLDAFETATLFEGYPTRAGVLEALEEHH